LGATVPGVLIVFVSPLVLLALAYYFAVHTVQLKRIADKEAEDVLSFAWLPLVQDRYWAIGELHLNAASVETCLSAAALPTISLAILFVQLFQFGGIGFWTAAVIVLSAFGVLALGVISIGNLRGVYERARSLSSAVRL
jgi:hypothetical protein